MERMLANVNSVIAAAHLGTKSGMEKIVRDYRNALREMLSKPGTGRIYRRRSVEHRASAKGQPPAPDTGHLRRSIQTSVSGSPPNIVGIVATNVEYAPTLEFGDNRVAPRPAWRPVLQGMLRTMSLKFMREIERAQREQIGKLK